MKTLRYFPVTTLLILTLTITAFAGEMTTGITTPQPAPTPAQAEGEVSTSVNGNIHTGYSHEATAGEAVVAGAWGVLQGVLSLL